MASSEVEEGVIRVSPSKSMNLTVVDVGSPPLRGSKVAGSSGKLTRRIERAFGEEEE